MNSTTLLDKAPCARRQLGGANVFRAFPEGNQIDAAIAPISEDVPVFPTTPTLRLLEVTCGLSAEDVNRLANGNELPAAHATSGAPSAPVSASERQQAIVGSLLAFSVAALLVLTIG